MTAAASRSAHLAAAAALASLTLLAGCNRDKGGPACPGGFIPSDASKVTRFREGPGRDLTDVVLEANVQNILIQCKYDRKVVVVDLQIAITADRGPADRARVAEVPYFVAITDPGGEIIQKQPFNVRFDFNDNRTRLGTVIDDIEPRIPLTDLSKVTDYRIVVGLQLTQEELAWNRAQAAKEKEP